LPQSVRVIIRNKKGKFLLVKDKWGWNFPGGKINPGETPEKAGKREVHEETGLEVESLEKIAEEVIFYANLSPPNQHWKAHFYQAKKYSGEAKIREEEKEKILDIEFLSYNSPKNDEKQQPYQFYLEKIKKLKKYAK
jgi:mutator protein MutT